MNLGLRLQAGIQVQNTPKLGLLSRGCWEGEGAPPTPSPVWSLGSGPREWESKKGGLELQSEDDAHCQAKRGHLIQGKVIMSLSSTWFLRSSLPKASRQRFGWEHAGLLPGLAEGRILFKKGLLHI